jgi:hypothetical protein
MNNVNAITLMKSGMAQLMFVNAQQVSSITMSDVRIIATSMNLMVLLGMLLAGNVNAQMLTITLLMDIIPGLSVLIPTMQTRITARTCANSMMVRNGTQHMTLVVVPPMSIGNMMVPHSSMSVQPTHVLILIKSGITIPIHAVANMVKNGTLLLIHVALDATTQMVKSGTIMNRHVNAMLLEKSGKMAPVNKCATQVMVKNSMNQLIHASAQLTNHITQLLTLVTTTVHKAKSGTTGMINASAHTERPSAAGATSAKTSAQLLKSGTHGTKSASALDGEKFSTQPMTPAAAQVLNSGILIMIIASVHSENSGTDGMTHASGMCSVTTLTLSVKKKTTMRMSTVSVSNGLVMPSEKESMNSSEKLKPLPHNGMTPLDQSMAPKTPSGTGNGERMRDRESNVRHKLKKLTKER